MSSSTNFGEGIAALAMPEVGIPLAIGKQLVPHTSAILMTPLIILSVVLVIIGIIVYAAAKTKTPGALLMILGLLLGGGAFFVTYKSESKKRSA
jgi:uncharacterized membrane-anchored protein